jgi:hypothetical protein
MQRTRVGTLVIPLFFIKVKFLATKLLEKKIEGLNVLLKLLGK